MGFIIVFWLINITGTLWSIPISSVLFSLPSPLSPAVLRGFPRPEATARLRAELKNLTGEHWQGVQDTISDYRRATSSEGSRLSFHPPLTKTVDLQAKRKAYEALMLLDLSCPHSQRSHSSPGWLENCEKNRSLFHFKGFIYAVN